MFGLTQKDKNRALAEALDPDNGSIEAAEAAFGKGAEANGSFGDSRGRLPLHLAAVMRPPEKAEQAIDLLLRHGAKIGETDADRHRPLDYAIAVRDLRIIKKLISAGADPLQGSYRATALLSAFDAQFWEGAEYLLSLTPAAATIRGNDRLPLAIAIESAAPLGLLEKLVAAKADVNAAAGSDRTALHAALAQEKPAYLDFVLGLPGVDVNIPAHNGITPLYWAVTHDNLKLAARLLGAGADPDRGPQDGDLPLLWAVNHGRDELATLLLQAGASPGLKDGDDRTALFWAVREDSLLMMRMLLDTLKPAAPAGPGTAQETDKVAGQISDKASDKTSDKSLDKAGGPERVIQPLVPNDLKQALFEAIGRGRLESVQMLVQAGADVNAEDGDGWTPLMNAARNDQTDIVDVLLKAGADLEATGLSGKTAFDIASNNRNSDAKNTLALARRNAVKKPAPPKVLKEDGPYKRLSDTLLEISEAGLTTIFNFRTQQVITTRGNDNTAPPVVQNFDDLQRQEAIEEAYNKLKELGGHPPEYGTTALEKKAHVLKKG